MKTEFLQKAEQNLLAAKICFENNLYDACANRTYYAAFHAAIALLIEQGVKRDKIDHKWVQAEFNRLFIRRRKLFPSRLKSFLQKMQFIRDQADYSDISVSKKVVFQQYSNAVEMIGHIKEVLGK